MGCRLFLIRHGETAWNKDSRLQGQTDILLSDAGRKQAEALSRRLAGENFSAFFSSNLKRSLETAEIIAKPHNQEVYISPGLQEINFGDWEGLTIDEIRKNYSEIASKWWASPLETRVPGGETLGELAERSSIAVKSIVNRYPNQKVVVVAHGGTIRSIVGMVLGLDLNQYWRLRQDNASMSIIELYQGEKGILMLYNDCNHLKDISMG